MSKFRFYLSVVFCLIPIVQAVAFYDESVEVRNENLSACRNLVDDYHATDDGSADVTHLVNQAINDIIAESGGGDLIIPQGEYLFGSIDLQSNIHIRIEKGTKIHHFVDDPTRNRSIFSMGRGFVDPIENISIRGIPVGAISCDGDPTNDNYESTGEDRFEVYLYAADRARTVINVGNVRNVYIANMDVYDEFTTHSCINFFANGSDWDTGGYAVGGTVENVSAYDCHYGYGVIQAHAAENVLFQNLHGLGGETLRLETGALTMNNNQFGGVHNIVGKDISCENGKGAVMLSPHNMQNGVVRVEGVRAISCAYGVTIGGGETLDVKDITNPDARPGTFAAGTYVRDVEVTYGTTAMLKWQNRQEVPSELTHLIGTVSPDGGKSLYGPSVAATKFTPKFEASISGVKAYGFQYTPPIQTAGTDDGDGITEDPFDYAETAADLDGDFWSVKQHLNSGQNWIRVEGGVATMHTNYAKASYHAVNFWGFALEAQACFKISSDFRFNHKSGGDIASDLNEAAFGFLLTTDPDFDQGINQMATLANRGSGIGLTGGTDGLILHSALGVDTTAGGWSDWFRMQWYIVQGAANYVGTVSIFDNAGNHLYTSAPVDLGIANGTKVFAGYTTGDSRLNGSVGKFSSLKRIQVDNFIFERGRIDYPPSFRSDPFSAHDAIAGEPYTAFITTSAYDVNDDEMEFSKVSGPAWLTVDANGEIHGTPGNGDVGANTYVVQVADANGLDTAQLSVSVQGSARVYQRLNPVADAFVEGGGDSSQNFGIRPELRVQDGAEDKWRRKSFLRFDLAAVDVYDIEKAIFRINVEAPPSGSSTVILKAMDDDRWGEYEVTWDVSPTVLSTTLGSTACDSSSYMLEFDLTDVVRAEFGGDQALSFQMLSSGNAISFHSREAREGLEPELILYSWPTVWTKLVADTGIDGALDVDSDMDGQSDFIEFSLGGNPLNSDVRGVRPGIELHPDGKVSFFHLEHADSSAGVNYVAQWCDDLTNDSWQSDLVQVDSRPSATSGYNMIERQMERGSQEQLFFRLKLIDSEGVE